jgi:hypothetical protein
MGDVVEISRGDTPPILIVPHTGMLVPPDIERALSGCLALTTRTGGLNAGCPLFREGLLRGYGGSLCG